ncbi:MAG: metallophosphoesterase [Candidatus Gastranaerophilales bacterium]|nr:metallophosphoesterase [Candidatus Gastranaerophilales bacterium]
MTNFKGAAININALSDTHGCLNLADKGVQSLLNSKDTFEREEKGKANYLIIGGDWFMSGGKKGFVSAPEKPLMFFQGDMYNKFVGMVKDKFPKTRALFVPGNHEFDGGADIFKEGMDKIDSTVVMSNLDFENSDKLQALIDEGKIVNSAIDFIADDKNPNLKHPVLNLGVVPVNLQYYSKLEGINLVENTDTPQKFVEPADYEKTMNVIRGQIDDFKKKYPKGVVILTCHTGVGFADNCAKMGNIDLIFDGHEHKDEVREVNGTKIAALSQNFNKIVNAKIKIDDEGNVEDIKLKDIRPLEDDYQKGETGRFYDELFKEDTEKTYTIKSSYSQISTLNTKNVRSKNSYLANFVTDTILSEIKEIDESVQIFALNASAIRNGFELSDTPSVSPLDVQNCLSGINCNDAEIYVNEVNGNKLAEMVLDNFLFNEKEKEKNPLTQYSGLEIDKTGMLEGYKNGEDNFCKYIKLTETKETISPDKTYKIANVKKYFIKTNNPSIKMLFDDAKPLNANAWQLFKESFEKNPVKEFTPDTRLY